MKNTLKTELWKAFHNNMLILSLSIGILLAIADVAQNAGLVAELTEITLESVANGSGSGAHGGYSLFVLWIAANGMNFGSRNFYLIWPVLAALPFGWSYFQERRNGAYNQVICRTGRNTYYAAKYLSVFISGGVAISVPVTLNLLLNALVCPDSIPLLGVTPIMNGSFFSALYYTKPWLHSLIWCGVDFLWGGVVSCLCLAFGTTFRYQIMVILAPFMCMFAFNAAYPLIVNLTGISLNFSPLQMAEVATQNPNPEWLVISVIGVLFLTSLIAGYWQVTKHEFV